MMLAPPPDRLATRKVRNYVTTGASDARAFATPPIPDVDALWRTVFEQLSRWGIAPSATDEDDLKSPSLESLTRAMEVLKRLWLEERAPAPNRLVGDGEGGLVAKWIRGTEIVSIRFSEVGDLESAVFDGTRLVSRTIS